MKEILDSAAFTDMLLCAAAALEQNKQHINELNVFPVPDGDTGTNMSMTLSAGVAELRRKRPDNVGDVAKCAASALLRGARGNSGVILSLLFRGLSKGLKGKDTCTAYDFAQAMGEGVDAAYNAVMKPAEGTILTVSRMSAAAAKDFAETGSDIELLLSCALESAKDALAETVNQNPVLKKAGVVDAGGKGYVVILDAMLQSLRGEVTPDSYESASGSEETSDFADFGEFDTGDITFAYDTVFIVRWENGEPKPLDGLRSYLSGIGDCLVIGESDEEFKVHVHTNTPGDALTEAQKYGVLEVAKIENMRTQHDELVAAAEASKNTLAEPEKDFGVVTVCAGEGIASLFRELGADNIVTGGQTMNPSTEDILTEVNKTPAEVVFVLPNNKNIIMAAQQCIPLSDKKVIVIPTKTVPQGITAMLSFDPASAEDVIEAELSAAIESVHTAQITYAARDSDFDGHDIHKGEYLALMDGALLGSDADLDKVLTRIADAANDLDPEIVSIYYGEDVQGDAAQHAADLLGERLPMADVNVVNGGQPVYYYMISFE